MGSGPYDIWTWESFSGGPRAPQHAKGEDDEGKPIGQLTIHGGIYLSIYLVLSIYVCMFMYVARWGKRCLAIKRLLYVLPPGGFM